MAKLKGKIAVITGGSSGQGLATAKRFVDEGAFVYIFARRQDELDKAVASIGRSVAAVHGDVSNLAFWTSCTAKSPAKRVRSISSSPRRASSILNRWPR